jgi:gliding motility-associated-like protein
LKKKLLLISFCLLAIVSVKSQTVSVYIWTGALGEPNTIARYENAFGVGNVTTVTGNDVTQIRNHDVVFFNQIGGTYPDVLVDSIVSFVQSGGHAVLSTEGRVITNGNFFMSSVWNTLTGDAITETPMGAAGTSSPPRFHNSNGPWGLSPDSTIFPSTTSYASFGNMPPLSVTHQRNLAPSTCNNIEGLSAVFPSKPALGMGTLYIQGEVLFPFYNAGARVVNHAHALTQFHFVMLTGNQAQLDILNTWGNNPIGEDYINDTILCENFTPYIVSGPDSASYSWEDRFGSVLDTNRNYTVTDTGKYYLRITANQNGCDGLDSMLVTYDMIGFDTIITSTCANLNNGAIEVINVASDNLTTPINYQLDNNPPVLNNIINSISPGVHQIKVTDARGCSDSLPFTVQSLVVPIPNFEFDTVCEGNQTVFTDLSNPTGQIAQWEWRVDGTTVITQNTSYTFNPASFLSVELRVEGNNSCVDSVTKLVDILSLSSAGFYSDTSCLGASTTFADTSQPNGFIAQWDWRIDGTTVNIQHPTYTFNTASSFNVDLKVTGINGCVDSTNQTVSVFPSAMANFSFTSECLADSTQFTDLSTPNGNISQWQWTIDSVLSSLQNPIYTFDAISNLTVNLKITSDKGCADSISKNVIILSIPIANFIFDTVCFGNSTAFTDFSTPTGQIVQWEWQVNGNLFPTQNTSYTFSNSSNLLTQLKVTNNDGCVDSISKLVEVNPDPLVNFYAPPVCLNSPAVFTNLTTESGKLYNTNYMFNWQFDDGNSSLLANPNNMYTLPGVYDVQLFATTEKGCTHDTIIQVTVYENPVADFTSTSVCFNQITGLTDQSSIVNGAINSWAWSIGNDTIKLQNTTFVSPNEGLIPITFIVSSSDGCFDVITKNVTVFSLPEVDFLTDKSEIDKINNSIKFTNQSTGGIFYLWLFDGNNLIADENPYYSFNVNGDCGDVINNKLIVETDNGCIDSITKSINVVGNLLSYVPNAFSPDGDGVNDVFNPQLIDVNPNGYTFQVFNRWGELIFDTDKLGNYWNGYHNNKLAQQGVYVWKIKAKVSCKNEVSNLTGFVTLIK